MYIFKQYLDLPGMEGSSVCLSFQKEQRFQKMVKTSFVDYQKINIFCFIHKGVAEILCLSYLLEIWIVEGHISVNFKVKDIYFWI